MIIGQACYLLHPVNLPNTSAGSTLSRMVQNQMHHLDPPQIGQEQGVCRHDLTPIRPQPGVIK